ncbi:MAG TPA: hypothetical protein ENG78_03610 [Acidiferrobacteraceae bacterium]|nr:hypothetical protein [Acidiferrobacteraceae bacterium]HEX19889.1 hypothetical protein [Acidiferrobacteraceae bacterium]
MSDTHLTINDLRGIDHECAVPFDLAIILQDGTRASLSCNKLVRAIPGRRLVFQAGWQGQDVFAKVFLDPVSASRDGERERQGSAALSQAGINTPALLYSGALSDGAYLLLFALIPDSMTFQQAWLDSRNKREVQLLLVERMYRVFAAHHNAGFLHLDPHQKNFLITDDVVYTLDCADIEVIGKPPTRSQAWYNLAVFFAITHADTDYLVATGFPLYCKERGIPFVDIELSILQSEIIRVREYSREQYLDKKIFRECTEFVRKKQQGRLIVFRRDCDNQSVRDFIESPDTYIEKHMDRYLKQGRSSTVAVVRFQERLFVVKRYNIKNLWKGVAHAWRRTRARKSWINAHRLLINGIRTAKPVILIENKFGPINLTSYFVTEYISGPNIQAYFQDSDISRDKKSQLADKIRIMFSRLNELNISHGDMKASNIIINNDEPCLMDLDSMRKHRLNYILQRRQQKDRARFLKNWKHDKDAMTLFSDKLL